MNKTGKSRISYQNRIVIWIADCLLKCEEYGWRGCGCVVCVYEYDMYVCVSEWIGMFGVRITIVKDIGKQNIGMNVSNANTKPFQSDVSK